MSVDKRWLTCERETPEYKEGLNSFIEMCKEHINNEGEIRCPCNKCHNVGFVTYKTMKHHLRVKGIHRNYMRWTYHGEGPTPPVVNLDDVVPRNNMDVVIEDLIGEHTEEDRYFNEENMSTESRGVHTDKNETFDSPIAEEEYCSGDQEDGGGLKVDEVAILEKVLGQRRGHVRGIGPRPPLGSSPGAFATESPPVVQHSKAYVMGLFENPDFCDQLQQFMASNSGSGYKMSKINESKDEEDGGSNDEDMDMD